jgi:hypothetical protein
VAPSEFDVSGFADNLGLGGAEQQVVLPDFSVTEWEHVRLQILPDRMQLGFKEEADGTLLRRVLEEFLRRKDELLPRAGLEFNAALQLAREEGEEDPSIGLLDSRTLASALGGAAEVRGGITLVFEDGTSRWWIELTPDPDAPQLWIYDFNRKFEDFPGEGDKRTEILDWFAAVEEGLVTQFEILSKKKT